MAERTWVLVDHVCRRCFGRVLREVAVMDGLHGIGAFVPTGRHRCSNCGHEKNELKAVCACGVQAGPGRFRCVTNPKASPEIPSEVVVVFDEEKQ
jgi:hypothetical protein